MTLFLVGDRVYYRNNGPNDTGTVLRVNEEENEVQVEFDGDWTEPDWYSPLSLAHLDD